jgi:hypothetical protein
MFFILEAVYPKKLGLSTTKMKIFKPYFPAVLAGLLEFALSVP